jgi:hypothetical protein
MNVSKLINYLMDMCWSGQGTTVCKCLEFFGGKCEISQYQGMFPWVPTLCTFLAQIVVVFMQKVSKLTHYFWFSPPPFSRSGDTHQTHKCNAPYFKNWCYQCKDILTWSKFFWLPSPETARCGFFQSGLRNSESIIETHSPIISANSGCTQQTWKLALQSSCVRVK